MDIHHLKLNVFTCPSASGNLRIRLPSRIIFTLLSVKIHLICCNFFGKPDYTTCLLSSHISSKYPSLCKLHSTFEKLDSDIPNIIAKLISNKIDLFLFLFFYLKSNIEWIGQRFISYLIASSYLHNLCVSVNRCFLKKSWSQITIPFCIWIF